MANNTLGTGSGTTDFTPAVVDPKTGVATVAEVVVTAKRKTPTPDAYASDLRVRLRAMPGQEAQVYGAKDYSSNILSILHETGGVLFPYTPSIQFEQSVDYKTIDLSHANYDLNAYSRTPTATVNLSGKFTVQNQREGQYVVAVMHFLRTVSKMHFGQNDQSAGLPPPILYFHGYGTYMFNGLKVIVKSHSYSLEDGIDYVTVGLPDGTTTRVPAMLTVQIGLAIQVTPTAMRKNFDLDQFRTGALLRKSKGWI